MAAKLFWNKARMEKKGQCEFTLELAKTFVMMIQGTKLSYFGFF
jgi:hypothetical protein